jgi:hypothetical protein
MSTGVSTASLPAASSDNFAKFAPDVPPEVREAGPRLD